MSQRVGIVWDVGVRGVSMLVKPMIMVIVSALLGPAMGVGLFLLMQVH